MNFDPNKKPVPGTPTVGVERVAETVRIWDEFDQYYDIDRENKLWDDAQLRIRSHPELKTVYPISVITDALEWGWWSCFSSQRAWLERCSIPMPDHRLLFGLEKATPFDLSKKLAEFGGYVSWLEAQVGVMEGRLSALKSGYAAAILLRSGSDTDEKKNTTEKSKEAKAIAKSETLKQTKRMQIEQETLLATARGMLDAYQRAWETVSRVTTIQLTEKELATGRHA